MLTDNQLWLLRLLTGLPSGFHEGLPERDGTSAAQMETDIGELIRAGMVKVFGPPNINCHTDEGMDVDELTLLPPGRAALRKHA